MTKEKFKISTYTDESGQDTMGVYFVVSTVCLESNVCIKLDKLLQEIETESGKAAKWHDTGNKRGDGHRHRR